MVRKPRLLNLSLITRRSFALGVAAVTVGIFPGRAMGRFAWPNGARAAVSLTYDDGCDSQLENVVPLLDELGLKATFFLTIECRRATGRLDRCRKERPRDRRSHHDPSLQAQRLFC